MDPASVAALVEAVLLVLLALLGRNELKTRACEASEKLKPASLKRKA
jgi:hypothetical protein